MKSDHGFFDELDAIESQLNSHQPSALLRRLLEITRRMCSTEDLQELLHYMLESVIELTEAESGFLVLADESGELEVRAAQQTDRADIAQSEFALSHSVVHDVLRSGRVTRVRDAAQDPRFRTCGSVMDLSLRSILVAPLRSQGKVVGALYLDHRSSMDSFSDSDEEVIQLFTDQASVALENARIYADLRQREGQIQEMNQRLEERVAERTEALRKSLELQARTTEQTTVSINTYDLEGRVLTWNAGSCELFERSLDEVAGKADFFHSMRGIRKDDSPEHHLAAVIARGHEKTEMRISSQIRGERRVLVESNLVRDRRGQPEAVVAVAIDVTDLRRMEKSLEQANRLHCLGEMANGVAHDFNNVLQPILGRVQLLKAGLTGIQATEALDVIERSARDGKSAVLRIQDFSRVRTDPGHELIQVDQLLEEVIEMTRTQWQHEAEARGVEYRVTLESAPEIPMVRVAGSELREVLVNLILNALDAMPDGGDLTLHSNLSPEGDVEIGVGDNGQGIPSDIRDRIFDPFFSTKGASGNGFGLSTSYGIIQRWKGRIDVETELGLGSEFRVLLPPAPGATSAVDPNPAPARSEPVRPVRILVVDDEEAIRSVFGDMLSIAGHQVTLAGSGTEALEHVEREGFDVVFTDLGMPGLSGWEVAAQVGKIRPRTPVVLVTGWGTQLDDARVREAGAAFVLGKPLQMSEVLKAVQQALAKPAPQGAETTHQN